MKRSLTLLLASLLLVFTLTACGRNDSQNNGGQNNGTTAGDNAVTGNPNGSNGNDTMAPGNGTNNGVNGSGGTIGQDIGGAIQNGVDDMEDALTGDNGTTNGTTDQNRSRTGGVTYEEMLRNARVHDTDGVLTDRENAVSSSRSY